MALLSLLGAARPASAITAYALTTANQMLVLLRVVFEAEFYGVQLLGDVSVNVQSVEGFDIAPHADEAFVVATVGGGQSLFAISLTTASFTPLGPWRSRRRDTCV